MSIKVLIFVALLVIAFQFASVTEARNAPPMTRIQEVFRSLMAPEEIRGKKYYQQYVPNAENQYFTEW
ncbi:Neuropeptide-Like Protein [Caenorhabditis elegans]|uniref:Neuropeptide-Like Protein n=1 Tax=Caenorhabditis elegans TaxID=6239 RepID=Q17772_CAEEL|nr:Neuropeptide-Like Protein [Caenorhabditis elegans]CCD63274.1 Neuropeptide-Like Protein [Caenorhabditis elegans]|eukprot:NP_508780.1 Uncharacterized protein CELE_C07A12.2 [Caenorhabditis elegans]